VLQPRPRSSSFWIKWSRHREARLEAFSSVAPQHTLRFLPYCAARPCAASSTDKATERHNTKIRETRSAPFKGEDCLAIVRPVAEGTAKRRKRCLASADLTPWTGVHPASRSRATRLISITQRRRLRPARAAHPLARAPDNPSRWRANTRPSDGRTQPRIAGQKLLPRDNPTPCPRAPSATRCRARKVTIPVSPC